MSKSSLRNYQIRQKLGSGSYGVIYKALNKIDKSTCVLKQIALSRMSQKAKKNAVNQAHIMGKLKHPFIVCYYQSFTQENNLNILMQYCDGGDLCYYLKQQNKKYLKQQKIWRFFIQIVMGLQHIHKNKILHRDIKTLNIFLNKNETVKIGDLGVAKMLNSNDFAHTMVGTPFYLSPQLCEQKPYNQKSDIWALGCLLYQLCTFKHPFQAANQASLILKIIRGKYQPIPQFYSKQLRQIIGACLQRDYKRRPTCNMILSKPNVKKMMEDFQLNKIVDQFYQKMNAPVQPPPAPQNIKPQVKIIQNKPPVTKTENKQPAEKPKKVLDQVPIIKQPFKPIQQVKQKKIDVNQNQNAIINKRKQSQPAINIKSSQKIQKDDKPKILFGSENKADFISALQMKIKQPKQEKKFQSQKRQIVKKNPISFEIPWKDPKKKQQNNQPQGGKIIIHNKNALIAESVPVMPQKSNQIVQRVKVQKKIQPRIYQQNKQNEKPIAIIKSGGFSQGQQRPQTCLDRKKGESNELKSQKKIYESKPSYQKNYTEQKHIQKQPINSSKNIRKRSQQRQVYLPQIKPDVQRVQQIPHYPPKIKKVPQPVGQQEQIRKPPKHLPHKSTSTSASRFTQVSKQQQDLVANLPDKVKKYKSDSDSDQQKNPSKTGPNLKFKQIDDEKVLKMYEQLLQSSRQTDNAQQIEEQLIQQTSQLRNQDNQQNQVQQQREELQDQSNLYYQINKYQTQDHQQQIKMKKSQEWSFDEQPELPMLQQTETPLFEQANPYLVEQSQQEEQEQQEQQQQKSQRELLIQKRQHLQIKLKENIKREDEINRLMQLKIEQCKSAVPKNFDEILNFFRSKINMDKQYTEEDEKQVESFLAKRNLTDQRKFQNIYKIMHFQMQLQNTRRIIQSICKKLNELQKEIKQSE